MSCISFFDHTFDLNQQRSTLDKQNRRDVKAEDIYLLITAEFITDLNAAG